jgi:hypothetical protein
VRRGRCRRYGICTLEVSEYGRGCRRDMPQLRIIASMEQAQAGKTKGEGLYIRLSILILDGWRRIRQQAYLASGFFGRIERLRLYSSAVYAMYITLDLSIASCRVHCLYSLWLQIHVLQPSTLCKSESISNPSTPKRSRTSHRFRPRSLPRACSAYAG